MNNFVFLLFYIRLVVKWILNFIVFVGYFVYDVFLYFKNRGYNDFNYYGLHLYTGAFGASKTSAMVRQAYIYAKRYKQLTIVSNVELHNFPEHTNIIPLKSPADILNAPRDTLVLIDEIGTIFNSRDFSKNRGSVPKPLYQHLCQNRHRNMMILATCQHYDQLDRQLRQITATVTDCSIFPCYPFSRLSTLLRYDGREYDRWYSNTAVSKPMPLSSDIYIQTNKIRSLYDTRELVKSMLSAEYVSDSEILQIQCSDGVNVNINQPVKKNRKRKLF